MTTTPERQPLSLSKCEDILAYVPHALGFHPQDSAVLMLIDGDQLEATLRVDLPKEEDGSECDSWITQVLHLLKRMAHIQGVVLVIYAPEQPVAASATPYANFVSELEQALNAQKVVLRHSWCRQGQLVWDYESDDFATPTQVRSVETNETHLSLVFAGSAPLDVPWDGSGIPEWPQAAEILKIISNQQHNVVHCLEAWLQTMDLSQAEAQEWIHNDHDHAALLLGSLDVKIVRDLLPYLAGEGFEASLDVLFGVMRGDHEAAATPLTNYLLGRGWHAPDWQRIDRLWLVSRDLLGVAKGNSRQALLCILAWIEWARGRGTMALRLLGRAVEENPNYELSKLLQKLMSHGIMPEWATDQLRAWRANFS
ncbi:DUF4192 domain-containing protein [Glutamicibacter arilaitensis]|uniref:DUF4192 domain-containing protein n=1 Tax=Glutamicibacter arilaitensis TaxID=256701 RepID=A0A2N7S371_9MICC|nr:DUF4192 domain-containing protein [Glutamicibacter arilaitensis]PMQ20606.1 hypothetical protein CIK84_03080 [Glutamicibacter arilaitensis]